MLSFHRRSYRITTGVFAYSAWHYASAIKSTGNDNKSRTNNGTATTATSRRGNADELNSVDNNDTQSITDTADRHDVDGRQRNDDDHEEVEDATRDHAAGAAVSDTGSLSGGGHPDDGVDDDMPDAAGYESAEEGGDVGVTGEDSAGDVEELGAEGDMVERSEGSAGWRSSEADNVVETA